MARRPIAAGILTWPDDNPALIGGRCRRCASYSFPVRAGCPNCGATDIETCPLERTGTLWTWTSQGFVPKAPFAGTFYAADPFEPWFVGLIELPGQLRLESVLVGCTQDTLKIGMRMTLTTLPLRTTSDGDEIITFAFAPAAAE